METILTRIALSFSVAVLVASCYETAAAAEAPTPLPTLNAVDFAPNGSANLILRTEIASRDYVRVVPLDTTQLPGESQAAISAGLAWLGSQLGEGYAWSSIALRRIPNGIPAVWSTPGESDDPQTFEPVLITPSSDRIVAAVYGAHPELGQSVIAQGTLALPDQLREGLLAIWAQVESIAQAGALPLPEPTPPVE